MSLINQGELQENNPEMLRQRAEILLDEMMPGNVANNQFDSNQPAPSYTQNSQTSVSPNMSYSDDETIALSPTHFDTTTHPEQSHTDSNVQPHQTESNRINEEVPIATPMQNNPWLFSAAERYRQNGYISSPPPSSNGTSGNSVYHNDIDHNSIQPSYNTQDASTSHSSTSINGNHPNQIAAPPLSSPPPNGTFQPMPGLGPVTRQAIEPKISEHEPELEAAEMRVGSAIPNLNGNNLNGQFNNKNLSTKKLNPKNSNLLPRMSVVNIQSLQKEVLALEEEIDLIVPSSHPSNDRAHHLLHKAYTILQNDIERSAEVEYYMQQVRSIIQRTRQMDRSSKTYNRNLTLYLSAWFLLALIVLAASYLYRIDIELWALQAFNIGSGNSIFQHLVAFSVTISAGVLGSAVSALYNMYNYSQQTFGLFDRKYGLRGLLLPIIGIFFGTFIYVLWALAGNFLQIDNNLNLFAGTLLASISFLFGMSQETIYGTRS